MRVGLQQLMAMQESNGALGSHGTVFPEAYVPESTQLGVCGVYPQNTYSEQVPADQAKCAHRKQGRPLKPSLSDDGCFCVCYGSKKRGKGVHCPF